MENSKYRSLHRVLVAALAQAAVGKGSERHGNDLPFNEQPMQTISKLLDCQEGLLFQAIKKTQESARMKPEAAVRELLGAINYLAGAIIFIDEKHGLKTEVPDNARTTP